MKKLIRTLIPLALQHAIRRAYLRRLARRGRALHCNAAKPTSVILIPPSPWAGNIGDTAMLRGLTTELRNVCGYTVCVAPHLEPELWGELTKLPVYALAPMAITDYSAWVPRLGGVGAAYLIGADVLDGKYSLALTLSRLEFIDFLATYGIPVVITGCSVRTDTPDIVISALRDLHRNVSVCARDPESEQRLRDWTKREIPRVTDVAFMLPPKDQDNPLLDEVSLLKSGAPDGILIGVAPNRLSVRIGELGDAERFACMVEYCVRLVETIAAARASANFLFIPHDLRSQWSDDRICDAVVAQLSEPLRRRLVVSRTQQPDEIKGALTKVDVLVTGRMHCGIGALGVGTPTIFLDYQDKVTGMLRLFDLDTRIEFIERPERVAAKTVEKIDSLLEEGVALRERILSVLPTIKEYSRKNVLENMKPSKEETQP